MPNRMLLDIFKIRGKTLKRKVIFAFANMLLIMMLGTGFVLYQLSRTVAVGHDVINIHQPAAIISLRLLKEVNSANALVNNYLLTGEKKIKAEFYQNKESILKIKDRIAGYQELQRNENKQAISSINSMINQFFDYAEKLFHLRENDMENYPGLALASELTDPYTLAYLGEINELINSDLDEVSTNRRQQVLKILQEMRYSWIQMNNAFRIFFTTRQDSDLKNFYSYSAVNGDAQKRLQDMHVDLGFDSLKKLENYRALRLQNVPVVAKVFQDEAWRQDVYIMRTEVEPLLEKIGGVLQSFANNAIAESVKNEDELTGELKRTYTFSGVLLIIGILFASVVGSLILRSIRPITLLTEAVKKQTLDNLVPIDYALLSRDDEVGRLANSFNSMTKHLINDIRERKVAERKFEFLLESLSDATVIVDRQGDIKLFNMQAEKLFGYTKGEVIDRPVELLLPERFRDKYLTMRSVYMERPSFRPMGDGLELFGLSKTGREIPIEIGLSPIETSEGLLVSAAIRDITERKETEQKLIRQANYDSLTDLPNRILALDRLSHAISSARRKPQSIAVMFIDLDNFKQVNDSLGHTVGDKLLRQVGLRLSQCTRANDTVARLGGDEFLIIAPQLTEIFEIDVIAQKIIDAVSHPCKIDERDIFIGASIGITVYPTDGDQPEVLLRNADAAMYQSKKAGRNTFRYFTHELNELLMSRLDIEYKLRNALDNGELFIHYQPMYDITKNKITGAEALLRWNHPTLGTVLPDKFISIAEETGLINKIGEWVLRESCHAAVSWQNKTGLPLRISVNASATQFRSKDLVEIVSDALAASGMPAELLELEITERVLMDDNPNVNRILKDIKRLGVRLVLDDFGTGYSSLGYLKRFRFDVLKIDRIFVSDITVNMETESLCRAIVAMAQSLNLDVVAEGIENEQQLNILKELGVQLVQGYYLSQPASSDKVLSILNRKNPMIRSV